MPQKPTIVDSQIVAESRLFQIEAVDLRFSNGEERTFERIKGKHKLGSVMVVPMLDAETVLLVKEYGAGIDDYFLSLPKGLVDEGEAYHEAANRELMEEVGFGANKITALAQLSVSPGYMSSSINVFLAEDLFPNKLEGDEPEIIEVIEFNLFDINQLIIGDVCCDSRTIAALYILQEKLHGQS